MVIASQYLVPSYPLLLNTEDRFWKALPIRWYSFGRAVTENMSIYNRNRNIIFMCLKKLHAVHFGLFCFKEKLYIGQ